MVNDMRERLFGSFIFLTGAIIGIVVQGYRLEQEIGSLFNSKPDSFS